MRDSKKLEIDKKISKMEWFQEERQRDAGTVVPLCQANTELPSLQWQNQRAIKDHWRSFDTTACM